MELIALLRDNPSALLMVVGVFGLVIGSFLNVVIHRLPLMLEREWAEQCRELLGRETSAATSPERFNLVLPGSHCPHCGHEIGALENIPVLSYLWLRGRCRHCGAGISLRYPLVEAITALLSVVVAWRFGWSAALPAALLLTWALVALTVIDLDHQLLPDGITQPFLWLGLGLSLFGVFVDPRSSIAGALAGYLSLWTVYWLFKLFTGKEGMGYGDFKLLALLGAWLGWQMLPLTILLSALVGAVVGVSLIALKRHEGGKPIPFGPYLAGAGWIALLWGEEITGAYLHFAGIG
ncbi:MAG: A24 family peptidase [Gammaproteobacteria bacterium]|nr:A24 family peptidase [Gammaproteobacteria bacterium]